MTVRQLPLAVAALLLAGGAVGAASLDGAALFEAHCSACHSAGGVGTPGLAPPLDRPEFWQALGGKPKAAFHYTVTIAVDTHDPEDVGRVALVSGGEPQP